MNRLTALRGEQCRGEWWKEGEGISQRTYMNDPWIWKMERGLTEGGRGGLSVGGQIGKNWDNWNRIYNKKERLCKEK